MQLEAISFLLEMHFLQNFQFLGPTTTNLLYKKKWVCLAYIPAQKTQLYSYAQKFPEAIKIIHN